MSHSTTGHDATGAEPAPAPTAIDPLAFAGAGAVVAAGVMLVLGVFGTLGVYTGAVTAMARWHQFFEPTVVGTAAGMVEAAVGTFVVAYAFAWGYNTLATARVAPAA